MPTGYCTTDDVRRVFQDTQFSGVLGDNSRQAVVDAIAGQSQWLRKATNKHWYVSGGVDEDDADLIPTSVRTRSDEYDLPTHGGYVAGAYDDSAGTWTATTGTVFDSRTSGPKPKHQVRLAFGDLDDSAIPAYIRVRLTRKNVDALNELHVVNADGGFDDWVSSNDYAGGVGASNRGDDYWVQVNSGGVSELYIDAHAMDDDVASFSNAVYVDIDYGDSDLPRGIRQAVAQLAAADLVQDDEFRVAIPDQGQLMSLESKAQAWTRSAATKLRTHIEASWALEELDV